MSRVNRTNENQLLEAREALTSLVCSASLSPLSICDENGAFKKFSDSLNPNFHCNLNFNSLEEDCLKVYKEDGKKVKDIFAKLDGRISISVDSLMYEKQWRIRFYNCVRAHFIDNDWKLHKWVILYCTDKTPKANAILKSLKNWDIEGKILSLTAGGETDLADYVKEDILKKNQLLFNGELFSVQCSCDIISQMVQKGFEMIDKIIAKVKELSWSKSFYPLWTLTSFKLKDALELEAMGEFSTEKIGTNYEVPSAEEWGKVKIMCRIADRIYEITRGLYEVNNKPTANLFLPHLLEIRAYLAEELASSDTFGKAVAQKMLEIYSKYWDEMYLLLAITAFMDPRYKMQLTEFASAKLDCEDKSAHVLETVRRLYDAYAIQDDQKEYLLVDSSSEWEDEDDEFEGEDEDEDGDGSNMQVDKQCHTIKDKLSLLREYCATQSANNQPLKSDLDLYLEEPVLSWTENFSVLLWWKDNCVRYPQLSKMARDFLAIPMSLATSNEAYYIEPREADMTVVSLKPTLMNALMCTRSWKLPCNPQ